MNKKLIGVIVSIAMMISFIPTIPAKASAIISIGQYLQMGTYYREPILWRCVDIDENGPLMLADKILTIKAYDAAGTHTYSGGTAQADRNGIRTKSGSNLWETSNIRAWLNSTSDAGDVVWPDGCPPAAASMLLKSNGYDGEKGFIADGNFTQGERDAMKPVTQKSVLSSVDADKLKVGGTEAYNFYNGMVSKIMQNYETAYYHNVTDKIFLLDVKQLSRVYQNSSILGEKYYTAKPSQKAVDNSMYRLNDYFRPDNTWSYWLRTPGGFDPSNVYLVNTGGQVFDNDSANIDDIGIRPAFYLDLSSASFRPGASGTDSEPYLLSGSAPIISSIEVTRQPSKLSYTMREKLSIDGLVVTGTYNDDSTRVEPIKESDITGFDSSSPAAGQVLTVTYKDKAATFVISIKASSAQEDAALYPVTRLSDLDRYKTCAAISKAGWASSNYVIITIGEGDDKFADALAGSPAAYSLKAPILLTDTYSLNDDTRDEIRRLEAKNAIILGGTGAVSDNVKSQLEGMGLSVKRLWGSDRYDTAVKIGEELNNIHTVSKAVITTGDEFQYAMVAAPFASVNGWPVLFTEKQELNARTEKAIKKWDIKNVDIIGNEDIVSKSVEDKLLSLGLKVNRIGGDSIADVNINVIKAYDKNVDRVALARDDLFADALAGASFAAALNMPIVLLGQTSVEPKIFSYLQSTKINMAYVFGGTGAVSEKVIAGVSGLNPDLYTSIISKKAYIKYEDKMKAFGYDMMYDNKSAKSDELVTKAEALKLALNVTLNTDDILRFAEDHNEYENAAWVEYAKARGITGEDINAGNCNEKAKYIDVISYFENCKIAFLKDKSVKDTAVYLKDMAGYSAKEQGAIKDMAANKIISLLSDNLYGRENIFKGQLNELVVNFAQEYSIIALPGDTINTDPGEMPANADQYPYIVTNVDKSVYETPLHVDFAKEFKNPKYIYPYQKENYPRIKEYSEEFFNNILNIDYRTINAEDFNKSIESYLLSYCNEPGSTDWIYHKNLGDNYVEYVIDNEIVIEGKSKLQAPIIYFDGGLFRARMRLTFEVKHSKTKENLLYLNSFDHSKITYEKSNYDILVDCPLSRALEINSGSLIFFLDDGFGIYKSIINSNSCGITREVNY